MGDGHSELEEIELNNLSGYKDSKPVRIGNGAFDQFATGYLMASCFDAIYLYSKYGHALAYDAWNDLKSILAWLGKHWEPEG